MQQKILPGQGFHDFQGPEWGSRVLPFFLEVNFVDSEGVLLAIDSLIGDFQPLVLGALLRQLKKEILGRLVPAMVMLL